MIFNIMIMKLIMIISSKIKIAIVMKIEKTKKNDQK